MDSMDTQIDGWPRPYYTKPGGKPFLYYLVYGAFPEELRYNGPEYRSAGLPVGISMTRSGASGPGLPDCVVGDPLWDMLTRDSPALAESVRSAPEVATITGELDDQEDLNYLRDTIGTITALLDHGGVAVLDLLRLQWWSAGDWRQEIFDPAVPVPLRHVVTLWAEDPPAGRAKRYWFHTQGMRKFGRPDISVHHTPTKYRKATIEMINRFIEVMAYGEVMEEGQEIHVPTLPAGMTCHYAGNLDDPDYNNVHLEITWP